MAGEASSRTRPLNAILEQDLEYDTVGKQVPLVTEEKVKNLEDKIKQRILEVRPFPYLHILLASRSCVSLTALMILLLCAEQLQRCRTTPAA